MAARPRHPPIARAKVVRLIHRGNRLFAVMERQNVAAMANLIRTPTGFSIKALHAANAAVEAARRDWNAACEDALSNGGV